jgi:hypothetical protein
VSYHAISLGDRREAIFRDDQDRARDWWEVAMAIAPEDLSICDIAAEGREN